MTEQSYRAYRGIKYFAKGFAIRLGVIIALGAATYPLCEMINNCGAEYASSSEPMTIWKVERKELCYDKRTGEMVRLTPLDYEQIRKYYKSNPHVWKDLECFNIETIIHDD
jgi:hypothetical protein